MRLLLPRTLLLAAILASTGAAADGFNSYPAPPGTADFSGLGLGLDLGVGIGAADTANISGGIGGAHVGYNLQNGQIVGGVEGDAMLASIQGGALGAGTFSQNFVTSARFKGGYAFGNLLAYGTLGWAWSTTDYSSLGGTSSRSVPGIAYGLGAEYAMMRSVSFRAELIRYNFDGATYSTPVGPRALTTSTNLIRLGVSTHF